MESVIQMIKGGIWGAVFFAHVYTVTLVATCVSKYFPTGQARMVDTTKKVDPNAEKKLVGAYQKDTSSDSFMLHGAAWIFVLAVTLGVAYLLLSWIFVKDSGVSPYFVRLSFVLPSCVVALYAAGWFIEQIPAAVQPISPTLEGFIQSGSDYLGAFENVWVLGLFIFIPAVSNAIGHEGS